MYTYDRMVREDGHVAGVVSQIKTPLRGITWEVESEDEQVRLFIEGQLGVPEGKTGAINFNRLFNDALSSVDLGFSAFEVLFDKPEKDGDTDRYRQPLKAVEFRPQQSIQSFDTTDQELSGIEQIDLENPNMTITIPGDRILYFAPNLRGTDWWGRSVLRPCYKHWYHKECLYLIQAISSERFAVPMPHAEYRRGTTTTQINQMKRALQAMHSDARAALITQDDLWRMRYLAPEKGQMPDLMPQVRHHNEQISAAILVMFMELGTSQTGSRAVSNDFVDIFYGSLRAYANYFRDQFNEKLVKPILEANFGSEAKAGLEWSNLSLHSIEKWVESVVQLASTGMIQWGKEDELTARHVVNIKDTPPTESERLELTPMQKGKDDEQ